MYLHYVTLHVLIDCAYPFHTYRDPVHISRACSSVFYLFNLFPIYLGFTWLHQSTCLILTAVAETWISLPWSVNNLYFFPHCETEKRLSLSSIYKVPLSIEHFGGKKEIADSLSLYK